jgi:hypothetical protein
MFWKRSGRAGELTNSAPSNSLLIIDTPITSLNNSALILSASCYTAVRSITLAPAPTWKMGGSGPKDDLGSPLMLIHEYTFRGKGLAEEFAANGHAL